MGFASPRALHALSAVVTLLAVLPSPGLAQVSCASADDLCVGDPCAIAAGIEVQSPCVVDFSPRTVVIMGPIAVPSGGMLSFTAGAIEVRRRIDGRHAAAGADVTLAATGTIGVSAEIDVGGGAHPGTITITAGGDITLADVLTSTPIGNGSTAPGGTITADAGGTLTIGKHGGAVASGLGTTSGGQLVFRGAGGVVLAGRLEADGSVGGAVEVSSSAGDVTLANEIRNRGGLAAGGNTTVTAQGVLTVNGTIRSEGASGGFIALRSDLADVIVGARVRARGTSAIGGTILASSPGTIRVDRDLEAQGETDGGYIGMIAQTVIVNDDLRVEGTSGNGGVVSLSAPGLVTLNAKDVRASGADSGGAFDVIAGSIVSTPMHDVKVDGGIGIGGFAIFYATSGSARLAGDVFANADIGGFVEVRAATVTVGRGAKVQANGRLPGGPGGEMHFTATAGDMVLDGKFRATGALGGTIDAQAPAGNLTAIGSFAAAPTGCTALAAGGTVDASAAVFDPPSVASCP